MPETDQSGQIQGGKLKGHQRIAGLDRHENVLSVVSVSQSASDQGHTGHGQGKGDHNKGQGKWRVIRQSKHKPSPGHHLHTQCHEVCKGTQP